MRAREDLAAACALMGSTRAPYSTFASSYNSRFKYAKSFVAILKTNISNEIPNALSMNVWSRNKQKEKQPQPPTAPLKVSYDDSKTEEEDSITAAESSAIHKKTSAQPAYTNSTGSPKAKTKPSSASRSREWAAGRGSSSASLDGPGNGTRDDGTTDIYEFVPSSLQTEESKGAVEGFLGASDDDGEDPVSRQRRENRSRVAACLKSSVKEQQQLEEEEAVVPIHRVSKAVSNVSAAKGGTQPPSNPTSRLVRVGKGKKKDVDTHASLENLSLATAPPTSETADGPEKEKKKKKKKKDKGTEKEDAADAPRRSGSEVEVGKNKW